MKMLLGALAVLVLMIGAPFAFAQSPHSKHPQADYLLGYTHGAMDGKNNPWCLPASECHWYVLQPGKGFKFETKEFIIGYVKGYCSIPVMNEVESIQMQHHGLV